MTTTRIAFKVSKPNVSGEFYCEPCAWDEVNTTYPYVEKPSPVRVPEGTSCTACFTLLRSAHAKSSD